MRKGTLNCGRKCLNYCQITALQSGKPDNDFLLYLLPANRIADYDRRDVKWRKFKEINIVNLNYKPTNYGYWEPMPSGLNSPVRLIPMNGK